MSPSSHLTNLDSPVRQYLMHRFSKTTSLTREANSLLKKADMILPADLSSSYPYGYIGTAINYRIRYSFAITPNQDLMAYKGAQILSRIQLSNTLGDGVYSRQLISKFFASLDVALETTKPVGRRLERVAERILVRYCYALSLFEEVYRSSLYLEGPLMMPTAKRSIEELLAIVEEPWVDDLCALSWLFYDQYNHLLSGKFTLNPEFAGSNDVGSADADLIVDGCLIELKASKQQTVNPMWIRQLAGYLLLDYENQHKIESIGIYMARHGMLFAWLVPNFLRTLTGDHTVTLPELRKEFRAVCQEAREGQSKRTGEPGEVVGEHSVEEMHVLLDTVDLVMYVDDREYFRISKDTRDLRNPYKIIYPKGQHPLYSGGYIGNCPSLDSLLANEGLEDRTDILASLEIVKRRK